MKGYAPMPWKDIGASNDGPMTEPRQFEARYDSRCHGCGGPIPNGTRVWGIKLTASKKWVVWHDKPSCMMAIEAKGFIKGAAVADPVWPRGMSQRELELLKLFEDELR